MGNRVSYWAWHRGKILFSRTDTHTHTHTVDPRPTPTRTKYIMLLCVKFFPIETAQTEITFATIFAWCTHQVNSANGNVPTRKCVSILVWLLTKTNDNLLIFLIIMIICICCYYSIVDVVYLNPAWSGPLFNSLYVCVTRVMTAGGYGYIKAAEKKQTYFPSPVAVVHLVHVQLGQFAKAQYLFIYDV